ncbi:MAG: methylenetetrahydrofolate reductase [Acidimicrobiia bacterium]
MTRIADLLADHPTLSFELFPPRTDEAERILEKSLPALAELAPDFMSVTYGAGGSTRERTRDIVVRINAEQPFPAMPHLTCVAHSRAEVEALLDDYAANGIENILALGGDLPADGSAPTGEFTYADELVDLVRARGTFSIGVAAHPEVHPRSPDRESDRRHLADKLERADFAMTNFFFDVDDYVRLVDELDALGCRKPVVPGVLPVTNVAGLRRMSAMNGSAIPAALSERLDAVEGDADAVREVGIETAVALGRRLLDAGAPGLHLYSMNRAESVARVAAELGLR